MSLLCLKSYVRRNKNDLNKTNYICKYSCSDKNKSLFSEDRRGLKDSDNCWYDKTCTSKTKNKENIDPSRLLIFIGTKEYMATMKKY